VASTGAIDEFDLIARVFRPLAADHPASLGLVDDAALIDPGAGNEIVVTTDSLSEGIHFRSEDAPEIVASRALGSNISDLAAMGAIPIGYTLALAAPKSTKMDWFEAFADGLGTEQVRYETGLIGGDTTSSSGGLMITITALGCVPAGCAVRRSTAQAGNDVWVTGTIGDAALGLDILQGRLKSRTRQDRDALIERFNRPTARIAAVPLLRRFATAAIDVSDGLAADLGHIGEVSTLIADIERDAIPLSEAAQRLAEQPGTGGRALLSRVISGGDDYEIVFTAPTEDRDAIDTHAADLNLRVSRIGTVSSPTEQRPAGNVRVLDDRGEALIIDGPGGYRHFQRGPGE